jgi:uncharacterized phage-associated protein
MMKPEEVAGYYLYRSAEDGDLITNLKMQKLVYYAYAWNLVINKEKLFDEPIEAWPKGPVVPSLYESLAKYGSTPIQQENASFADSTIAESWRNHQAKGTLSVLDQVYEAYSPLSAFELVAMTHNEKPWKHAREGLTPTERCNIKLLDSDIRKEFGARLKRG